MSRSKSSENCLYQLMCWRACQQSLVIGTIAIFYKLPQCFTIVKCSSSGFDLGVILKFPDV